MFSKLYIKIYLVLIIIIIKNYDPNNFDKNIQSIYINNIETSYFLNLKNYIGINNKNMDKLLIVLKKYSESYFKKILNIKYKKKIKLLVEHNKIYYNILNNQVFNNQSKIKTNNTCIITLEELEDKYFYCYKCNTKYSSDGYLYWSESNHNCSTPWCTNSLDNFYFLYRKNKKF